jgi:uncharacterized protein involved in cysteine biosynthesis
VDALLLAFRDLVRPRMLMLLVFGPLLCSALVWGGLALWFWSDWLHFVEGLVSGTGFIPPVWLAGMLGGVLALLIVFPLVLGTALLVVAVIAMPVMVREISARRFPALERKHGGSLAGSLLNFFAAFAGYVALWLLALPLCVLVAPFGILLSIGVSAWFNQKLFRYDALAEHASGEEFRRIIDAARPRLYGLGFVLAVLQFVPLLNLAVPLLAGLAFIHLTLAELEHLRSSGG